MREGLEGWGGGVRFLRERMEVEGFDEKWIEDDLVMADFLLGIGPGLEIESAAAADLDASVEGGDLGWTGFLAGTGFCGFGELVERAASVA